MPGYSPRALVDKLGLEAGHRALLVAAPPGYLELLAPLPKGILWAGKGRSTCDFIQVFGGRRSELAKRFPPLVARLAEAGMLWVSWPKRTSGVASDLDENVVRAIGLAGGLVDVKVAAVTEVWSGLKFMRRLRDRR